jgi:uncharacterized metal-binding protein
MNIRPKSDCGCGADATILLACSGASDVGEIADRAACKIPVIDGCSTECGKKAMRQGGIDRYLHLRLEDLGLEKGKAPATRERIEEVVIKASQLLA